MSAWRQTGFQYIPQQNWTEISGYIEIFSHAQRKPRWAEWGMFQKLRRGVAVHGLARIGGALQG